MTLRDDKIVNEILLNGGISLDVRTNRTIDKKTGYMVAMEGKESTCLSCVFDKKILDLFIEEHLKWLTSLNTESFLGAWVDNGIVYLDVSFYVENKESAINYGMMENQLAIYDIKNECSITL